MSRSVQSEKVRSLWQTSHSIDPHAETKMKSVTKTIENIIADVVRKYLVCGDLKQGFARVRCDKCGHEYLLSFSCKGRYFCTSCHRSQRWPSPNG
jgi:hypothetical protein